MRIFSYLPNPRVWKAQIAAELSGAKLEVIGARPPELQGWLWDFDARKLSDDELADSSAYARASRRGFGGTLYKTDAFLEAHPFGTVPAAFSDDGSIGVFESNSILRAAARTGASGSALYPENDPYRSSRIDSFLDAGLVFGREFQVYMLSMSEMTPELYERMAAAYEFYLDGIDQALKNSEYLAGDELSIADIAFVCDLAQFLLERRMAEQLAAVGKRPVAADIREEYPHAYRHLLALSHRPIFYKYLERIVKDLPSAA